MLTVLDLFSGIGGFSLGLEKTGHFRTSAFCEIDEFCRKVLAKHRPSVPVFEDIRKLKREDIYEPIDVVCGGFPCQPFSTAGKRRGKEDDRDLWPEMFRIVKEFKPTWVIGENVAGFVNMALDRTVSDLEGEGYEVLPFIIPACALGAPHRRDRVWIIAHSGRRDGARKIEEANFTKPVRPWNAVKSELPITGNRVGAASHPDKIRCVHGEPQEWPAESGIDALRDLAADDFNVAHTNGLGLQGKREESDHPRQVGLLDRKRQEWQQDWAEVAARFCRMDDGISNRVDRLKALGNTIVPWIPYIIGQAIILSQSPLVSHTTGTRDLRAVVNPPCSGAAR